MMFVREDKIMPHDISFHDLIVAKVTGTAGSFCRFDELWKHGGRRKWSVVCERRWYEKNRAERPADRWELFDLAREDASVRGVHSGMQGDWNCPACKSSNFGSKNPKRCWKCG
eukprot:Hpha_TRINITY_DN11096_c0_g1::TRINITY_DN11096_c0_g1_i1::g.93096::m.93096/K13119/FAM50, XAP5; protein FAM50